MRPPGVPAAGPGSLRLQNAGGDSPWRGGGEGRLGAQRNGELLPSPGKVGADGREDRVLPSPVGFSTDKR